MKDLLQKAVFSLCLCSAAPVLACDLVHGPTWAFVAEAPRDWRSACGGQALEGTAITLWPAEADGKGTLIYVTVSDSDGTGLEAFAADEQARFNQSPPVSTSTVVGTGTTRANARYVLVGYDNARENRQELVAYLGGSESYFILVLTAPSAAALGRYKEDFLEFLDDFTPMAGTGGAGAPATH